MAKVTRRRLSVGRTYREITEADLTPRQLETLRWVAHFIYRDGHCPSQRQVSRAMGCRAPHGCMGHIAVLIQLGLMSRVPAIPRSLSVTPQGRDLAGPCASPPRRARKTYGGHISGDGGA